MMMQSLTAIFAFNDNRGDRVLLYVLITEVMPFGMADHHLLFSCTTAHPRPRNQVLFELN